MQEKKTIDENTKIRRQLRRAFYKPRQSLVDHDAQRLDDANGICIGKQQQQCGSSGTDNGKLRSAVVFCMAIKIR